MPTSLLYNAHKSLDTMPTSLLYNAYMDAHTEETTKDYTQIRIRKQTVQDLKYLATADHVPMITLLERLVADERDRRTRPTPAAPITPIPAAPPPGRSRDLDDRLDRVEQALAILDAPVPDFTKAAESYPEVFAVIFTELDALAERVDTLSVQGATIKRLVESQGQVVPATPQTPAPTPPASPPPASARPPKPAAQAPPPQLPRSQRRHHK
jgi:hypothetical protein